MIPNKLPVRTLSNLLILLVLNLSFSACGASRAPVPVGVIPKSRPVSTAEEQYGHTVLQKMSEKWEIDYNDPRFSKVQDIVDKLTLAAGADKDPWHVYLFKAPDIKNAAATRGNHVFVWSGMLDWIQNDDELATILGHELAHVLARHTDPDPNEQAKKILVQMGAMAAGIAVTRGMDGGQSGANLGRIAAGVTQQLGQGILVNPYSRQLEHEADHVGLMIMSKAGYKPERALDFWGRAQRDPSFGGGTTAFFSTHPPAADRLQKIKQAMPIANQHKNGSYRPGALPNTSPKSSSKKVDTSSDQYAQQWTDKYYEKGKTRESNVDKNGIQNTDSGRRNNRIPNFAIDDPRKQQKIKSSEWKVVSSRAYVYQKPDISSKRLGELKRGGKAVVVRDLGSWLEIFEPDHGFIEKADLAKLHR